MPFCQKHTTRRHFLRTAAVGLAAPTLMAGPVLGNEERSAASARLTVRIIGVGKEEFATADRQRLFRNVKDFGAVGDGVADDTTAIQRAINHNQGDRGPKAGGHVFLPSGTYKITRRLTLWSQTYFMGDPLDPPTLLLPANTPDFQDPEHPNALIATWNGYNCDPEDPWFYQVPMPISAHDKGDPKFASSNNLFRVALGNFKIVIEPGNPGAVGMYTRLAQQTQLVNITVKSSDAKYGIWGNANFFKNLVIEGGQVGLFGSGASVWTFRNLTIRNTEGPAIQWQGLWNACVVNLLVEDCGSAMSLHTYGSLVFVNTTIRRTREPAIQFASPDLNRTSYVFSNLVCDDVAEIIAGRLPGEPQGTVRIPTYVMGDCRVGLPTEDAALLHERWAAEARKRPDGVLDDVNLAGIFAAEPPTPVLPPVDLAHPGNVVRHGAKGDGETDDTAAIQRAIDSSETVFLPIGRYVVTDTLHLKANTRLIGEHVGLCSLTVPKDTASFADPNVPKPVVSTPDVADSTVALQDFGIFSQAPGSVAILWRCGGRAYIGNVHPNIGHTHLHFTGHGGGVIECMWAAVGGTQYGLYAEDCAGPAWFYGLGCEHQLKVPYYLKNCRGFTLLCPQTETSPVDMVIDGCDRIVTLGKISGNWRGMWCSAEIRNSTNILMAGTTLCRTLYFLRDNPAATPPGTAVDIPELTVYGDPHPSRRWSVLGLYYRGDFQNETCQGDV